MKKTSTIISFLLFSITSFSQTSYMSIPDQPQEYISPINFSILQMALEKKQRDYENSRKINCNSLISFLIDKADSSDYISITSSTMLSGVRYYLYNNGMLENVLNNK